ncbi:MAG: bifunctional demethylmenaquinone methyltransferase/2-methoxy-6-polyprenyl-1,4-benzoquinol methylase UbiE [Candidatus Omnitrophota bacterium]|nr:bifunctional demethylmenaquinone methyltransferase/2-methoxy-6-polyprenyl-1,4-benzoquinol methylase UbiE [Candidatus Omnitrophota bacterium]
MFIEKNNLSEVFSGIAPYYDLLNHILSFNRDKLWRMEFIATAGIKENARILDLCTGTADIAIECAKRKNACQVFGVDFSEEMLKQARDKINRLGLEKQIYLIKADVFKLPFHSDFFDLVSISFGLRNLIDYSKGMEKMANMLKKGGKVIILEFSPPLDNAAGRVYDFYLKKMVPLVALICGGSTAAYKYLSSSISAFLYPKQILNCMELAGLKNLSMKKMCLGVVNAYYGEK